MSLLLLEEDKRKPKFKKKVNTVLTNCENM